MLLLSRIWCVQSKCSFFDFPVLLPEDSTLENTWELRTVYVAAAKGLAAEDDIKD